MTNEYKEKQKAEKDETLLIRCRELSRAGEGFAAVKLYRAEKRCALKPAMDAINALWSNPNIVPKRSNGLREPEQSNGELKNGRKDKN